MINYRNLWAAIKDRWNNNVLDLVGSGVPTNGTSGTGATAGAGRLSAGPGSTYTDLATGLLYININTAASPTWTLASGATLTTLTSAQVKAVRATPITLVAAPPAGFSLKFMWAKLFLDYGGTNVFTEVGNNLAVRFNDGSGPIVSQTIEMTGFIDQNADTETNAESKIDAIASKASSEAKALVLHNTSGAEIAGNAAGDNILRVRTAYRVVPTGF